jgi:hypothetical protein
MTRAERKRRAATAALALLEWRDRMARENADRENAERETTVRYGLMVAAMQAQADEFGNRPRRESPTRCDLVSAMVHGNGAAGAL